MKEISTPSVFVSYLRVSTQKQGQSGLGLDAQRDAIQRYVHANTGSVLQEFVEMESGRNKNRPQLAEALALCRQKRAVLLIAKLDRLARNVHFLTGIMESGASFAAVDNPTANPFMLHIQAAFAEEEARRISQRTKEALAAAKRRGVVIGATGAARAIRYKHEANAKAETYRKLFEELGDQGAQTTKEYREALNALGIAGPGGGRWHLPNVFRTLKRLGIRLERSRKSLPL